MVSPDGFASTFLTVTTIGTITIQAQVIGEPKVVQFTIYGKVWVGGVLIGVFSSLGLIACVVIGYIIYRKKKLANSQYKLVSQEEEKFWPSNSEKLLLTVFT